MSDASARDVIRETTPADAAALHAFTCAESGWYGEDAQTFIRTTVAGRALLGLNAWVVERDGEIVSVAAHEPRPHPGDAERTITLLSVLAHRDESGESWLARGIRLSRLLRVLSADIIAAGREPLCYTLVAEENAPMREFCERYGFTSGPTPSDPRYRFYTTRFKT